MTMLVAQLGLTICGEVTTLSLRLGFILLFAGSTWVLFRWTSRWYGEWAGFYAALALNLAAYYTAAAGAFALPDGPLLFFSLLTLWGLSEALIEPTTVRKPWAWVWVGLACAGALLSKYHAVFLPAGALLYILVTPGTRRWLLRPGPYLAAGLGLCGFLPVLIWNLQHDWASFAFQASRAVGWRFRPDALLVTIGGQVLYLFPWIWLALVLVLFRLLRTGNALGGVERLLLCHSVVPLSFFLAVSCVRMSLPHWSLTGFVPLFPVVGAQWAAMMTDAPGKTRRRFAWQAGTTIVLAAVIVIQTRLGVVHLDRDPSLQMKDWTPVVRELEARGLVGQPGTFLFTRCWFESGHLAFAVRNRAPVLCYDEDARGFAYWSQPEDWLGQDGILVSHSDNPTEYNNYTPYFRKIQLIAQFPSLRNGQSLGIVRVFRCTEQIQPFPFRPDVRRNAGKAEANAGVGVPSSDALLSAGRR
jgi:hypothetical protein